MDVKYINPFVGAVQEVFQTMLGLDAGFGKPYLKQEETACADISAVIGFSGDATGSVVISFPKLVAIRTASAFAGVNLAADHPDFADALGELASMVSGSAKKHFEGADINISLPNVIVGENHRVSKSNAVPRLVIPCESPLGPFYVEVGMKIEKSAAVAAS